MAPRASHTYLGTPDRERMPDYWGHDDSRGWTSQNKRTWRRDQQAPSGTSTPRPIMRQEPLPAPAAQAAVQQAPQGTQSPPCQPQQQPAPAEPTSRELTYKQVTTGKRAKNLQDIQDDRERDLAAAERREADMRAQLEEHQEIVLKCRQRAGYPADRGDSPDRASEQLAQKYAAEDLAARQQLQQPSGSTSPPSLVQSDSSFTNPYSLHSSSDERDTPAVKSAQPAAAKSAPAVKKPAAQPAAAPDAAQPAPAVKKSAAQPATKPATKAAIKRAAKAAAKSAAPNEDPSDGSSSSSSSSSGSQRSGPSSISDEDRHKQLLKRRKIYKEVMRLL